MWVKEFPISISGQKTGDARLVVYHADSLSVAPDKKRPMVIVCGGGAYGFISDREQEAIVLRFLSMGCHAALLYYSVEPNVFPTALLELASAVAMVKSHGEEWKVDRDKVITCGFSAGGHLVASLGVFWNRELVYAPLGLKPEEVSPAGQILCYPVITSGDKTHQDSMRNLLGERYEEEKWLELMSLEKQVTGAVPKTFLWHTMTDESVPVENSLYFAQALKDHGVNFEMHIYPVGGHGISLANEETSGCEEKNLQPYCEDWIVLAGKWLKLNFA